MMEHSENHNEKKQEPIDISKLSPPTQAYLEARAAFIKEHNINLPEWNLA